MTGKIGKKKVAVGIVYLWTVNKSEEANKAQLTCLQKDVEELNLPTIILGDFNAHIEELDERTDKIGRELLCWMEKMGLVMVNGTDKCKGKITWAVRERSSCIDYCLMSPALYESLTEMTIDETGAASLGSDHRRLTLEFGANKIRQSPMPRTPKGLTSREMERVVEELEKEAKDDPIRQYTDIVNWMCKWITKVKGIRSGHRKRRRRRERWWDTEVGEARNRRRAACRKHGEAVKKRAQKEYILKAWEEYQEKKIQFSTVVPRKMKKVDRQLLEELRSSGRDAPRKVWQHVRGEERWAEPNPTTIRDATSGVVLTGQECISHIALAMAESFEEPDAVRQSDPLRDSTRGTEQRRAISQGELNRAMQRMDGHTATGLDDIPAGVLKKMGGKSRERLLEGLSCVMETDDIPEDWRRSQVRMLYKGKGDKLILKNHRPIKVTSVLYRIFMHVLKERLQSWAEHEGILWELQNGFHKRRRLEDNLFVITQAMEIANHEQRPQYLGFLDISKAYNSVNHSLLWRVLEELGMPVE
ncbi:hypothetical protein HPB47_004331 [Ixodes persulcatus]|uniref:Uncharacterized protein n=1 Tax=Ixodes persulcatus TaxID=34615 RepID=A0AC60PGU4_IXOPE|nr:hypothetical protein HPB47_004331 [Ixodes persulcatus]